MCEWLKDLSSPELDEEYRKAVVNELGSISFRKSVENERFRRLYHYMLGLPIDWEGGPPDQFPLDKNITL